ncbi:MAG: adenylate/guanylate cyclase domain-containing protein [Balneolales bacterium]
MWIESLQKRRWIPSIIAAIIAILLALAIGITTPFRVLEMRVTDLLFHWRGPLDASDSPVVLVSISNQADQEFPETWPWPRSYHARLVDNLNAAGVRAIGFDVIFMQPDTYDPLNDTLFAEAIERHGNVVLAGDIRVDLRGQDSEMIRFMPPYHLLQEASPNPWGYVSSPMDEDGSVRRYQPVKDHLNTNYHTLGLELIRIYKGLDSLQVESAGSYYDLGFVRIPKFDRQSMLINYHGGTGTFPEYSYEQIIDDGNFILASDREFFGIQHPDEKDFGDFDDPVYGLRQSGVLQDKIVIVGSTITELRDFHAIPYSFRAPGYEIHAHAIQTILAEQFLQRADYRLLTVLFLLPVFLICFLTIYRGVLTGFAMTLALAAGMTLGVAVLFIEYRIRLELILPLLPMLLGYLTSTGYKIVSAQREARRIRNMFDPYVSRDLVDIMIESGEEPQLGGQEVYITAFFSDIQSFSSFSEKLPPAQLVDLINEYMSPMTEVLTDGQGTLDKYIGDSIVAFFGSPIPLKDHALKACITSQRMLIKQQELREKWKSEGDQWPDIVSEMQTRIGINTGEMVTGNMGSERRFNYTMMGDNVNLAARCESGSKTYGVFTMVTEHTKNEAELFGNDCVFRLLDKAVVLGRTQPVDLYEITGLRSILDRSVFECIECYEAGRQELLNQQWSQAIKLFRESAKLEPHQPGTPGIYTNPSLVMIERCETWMDNPPGKDWNGVFIMDHK